MIRSEIFRARVVWENSVFHLISLWNPCIDKKIPLRMEFIHVSVCKKVFCDLDFWFVNRHFSVRRIFEHNSFCLKNGIMRTDLYQILKYRYSWFCFFKVNISSFQRADTLLLFIVYLIREASKYHQILYSDRRRNISFLPTERRKTPNWKLRYGHHSTINDDHTVISILDFRFLSGIIQDFHHRKLERCGINLSSKHSQMIHLDNSN